MFSIFTAIFQNPRVGTMTSFYPSFFTTTQFYRHLFYSVPLSFFSQPCLRQKSEFRVWDQSTFPLLLVSSLSPLKAPRSIKKWGREARKSKATHPQRENFIIDQFHGTWQLNISCSICHQSLNFIYSFIEIQLFCTRLSWVYWSYASTTSCSWDFQYFFFTSIDLL